MTSFSPQGRSKFIVPVVAGIGLLGISEAPAQAVDGGKAGVSPFIDQVRSELQEAEPDAEPSGSETFLQRERKRLSQEEAEEKGPETAEGSSYTKELKAGLEAEEREGDGESESWLERERKRLRGEGAEAGDSAESSSAIKAVKAGKGELKGRKDPKIRYSAGFHVAANTTRSIDSTSSGGSGLGFGSVYTQEMFPPLGLHFDYQPLRWNGVFSLGVGLSLDVSSHRGTGVFKVPLGDFGNQSDVIFRFVTVGTGANAVFRLDLIPGLQPWIAAGPVALGYREYRNDGGTAYQGYALGTRMAGGLNIRLDALMDSSSWDTVQEMGLNHIYLTAMFVRMNATSDILSSGQDSIFGGFTYEY